MKKYIFTILWAIICIEALVIGHSYWKERTTVKADTSNITASSSSKPAAVQKSSPTVQPDASILLAKAKNWPGQARTEFQQSIKQNRPFKILFAGSTALGSEKAGMLKSVTQQLTAAYGQHIVISVDTFNTTSGTFLANKDDLKLAAEKAQLIIFEPFMLNDNGNGDTSQTLNHLTATINQVKGSDPGAVFILQPSFPLYQAIHYPVQVAQLKQYAAAHQITYLDHWTVWPAANNAALKNYLTPDESAPSDKGNQVWSQYLIHYLISQ